jgi:hypothetical protein
LINLLTRSKHLARKRLTTIDGLARRVENAGDAEMAYNLGALALGNDPNHGDSTQVRARYCLRLAEDAGKAHQIAMCSTRLARILADDAEDALDRRLAAFDACENAIERIAAPSELQEIAAEELIEVFQKHSFLRVLYPALIFALPENSRPQAARDLEGGQLVPRASDVSVPDVGQWARDNFTTLVWETEVENARFALEPSKPAMSVGTDWLTFDFDHPAFRRCVPHSDSILKEEADTADDLFLTLAHEITHVLCLIGALGAAITALRMASLHTELCLWSSVLTNDNGAASSPGELDTTRVAPLSDSDVIALGRAEQALELTAKTRILQDVWKPWMEGVAVFSESADPRGDESGIAEQNEAVRQFVDQYPAGTGAEANAELLGRAQAMEDRHSLAVNRFGRLRLSTIFRMPEEPYFAGYLLVRSVVGAWRETLGEAVSGARVQSLLLHATRYGIADSIPDLGLAAEEFREACIARMLGWIGPLVRLDRDVLADFLAVPTRDGSGRTYRWRDGKPERVDPEDAAAEATRGEFETRQRQWILEAISTLTGSRASAGRVADASPQCAAIMGVIADVLDTPVSEERVNKLKDIASGILNAAMVLPVGSTDAKFILNTAARRIWLSLRTREKAERGEPGYNGESFILSEDHGEILKREYLRLGRPRVRVTRVIDLVKRDEHLPAGMHFLAYSCGDWMFVRPAGFLAGAHFDVRKRIEAIRHRLVPNRDRQAEQEIARGNVGAQRTQRWLGQIESWTLEGRQVPIEPWVSRVKDLAQGVLHHGKRRTDTQQAAKRALAFVLGNDEVASLIVEEGFAELTTGPAGARREIIDILFQSAQSPCQNAWIEQNANALHRVLRHLLIRGIHGWDVRSALSTEGGRNANSSYCERAPV